MLNLWQMSLTDVVFSHRDTDGTDRHFVITRLIERLKQGDDEIVEAPMDYAFALHVQHHFGIEQHRLARITPQVLDDNPMIYAHFTPKSPQGRAVPIGGVDAILIDGAHRYLKAAMLGRQTIKAFLVPESLWTEYLLDVPPELNEACMADVIAGTAESYIP